MEKYKKLAINSALAAFWMFAGVLVKANNDGANVDLAFLAAAATAALRFGIGLLLASLQRELPVDTPPAPDPTDD